MNIYTIYKITSPSGKSYIGQTNNFKRRMQQHKNSNSHCSALNAAIKKYGWPSLKIIILDCVNSIELSNEKEKLYISSHNTISPYGYNLRSGGESSVPCQETRDKISEKLTGIKRTQETKDKISLSGLGRKASVLTKIKMSKSHSNTTQETRDKISEKLTGIKRTQETKDKISKGNIGKIHSEEQNKKHSEDLRKIFLITFPDLHQEIIENLKEFCKNNDLNYYNMNQVSNGWKRHHKGFKCEHYNKKDEKTS